MERAPEIEEILNDPTTSIWLKNAITESLERDIVDAVNDVEILSSALRVRYETLIFKR